MLNFHIIKVDLKSGEVRYRTILTKSGKNIKSKTFRRKQYTSVSDEDTTALEAL